MGWEETCDWWRKGLLVIDASASFLAGAYDPPVLFSVCVCVHVRIESEGEREHGETMNFRGGQNSRIRCMGRTVVMDGGEAWLDEDGFCIHKADEQCVHMAVIIGSKNLSAHPLGSHTFLLGILLSFPYEYNALHGVLHKTEVCRGGGIGCVFKTVR